MLRPNITNTNDHDKSNLSPQTENIIHHAIEELDQNFPTIDIAKQRTNKEEYFFWEAGIDTTFFDNNSDASWIKNMILNFRTNKIKHAITMQNLKHKNLTDVTSLDFSYLKPMSKKDIIGAIKFHTQNTQKSRISNEKYGESLRSEDKNSKNFALNHAGILEMKERLNMALDIFIANTNYTSIRDFLILDGIIDPHTLQFTFDDTNTLISHLKIITDTAARDDETLRNKYKKSLYCGLLKSFAIRSYIYEKNILRKRHRYFHGLITSLFAHTPVYHSHSGRRISTNEFINQYGKKITGNISINGSPQTSRIESRVKNDEKLDLKIGYNTDYSPLYNPDEHEETMALGDVFGIRLTADHKQEALDALGYYFDNMIDPNEDIVIKSKKFLNQELVTYVQTHPHMSKSFKQTIEQTYAKQKGTVTKGDEGYSDIKIIFSHSTSDQKGVETQVPVEFIFTTSSEEHGFAHHDIYDIQKYLKFVPRLTGSRKSEQHIKDFLTYKLEHISPQLAEEILHESGDMQHGMIISHTIDKNSKERYDIITLVSDVVREHYLKKKVIAPIYKIITGPDGSTRSTPTGEYISTEQRTRLEKNNVLPSRTYTKEDGTYIQSYSITGPT